MSEITMKFRAVEALTITEADAETPVGITVQMPVGASAVSAATIGGVTADPVYDDANSDVVLYAEEGTDELEVAVGDAILITFEDSTSFVRDVE